MSVVSIYAVFANREEAERIGRAMVERQMAACVNILDECQSIYRWEGAVRDAREVPALFKSTDEAAQALVAAIVEAHSYANPAVVVWPIKALPGAYGDWVEASVR
jgi:periplasmic divalent cation tolerance protein